MSKHTPGPWLRDGNFVYALTDEGPKFSVNRFCAAVTAGQVHHMGPRTPSKEIEANARLIATAPRLHSELKDLLNVLDHLAAAMPILNTAIALTAARDAGRMAIAEAEGTDSPGGVK